MKKAAPHRNECGAAFAYLAVRGEKLPETDPVTRGVLFTLVWIWDNMIIEDPD